MRNALVIAQREIASYFTAPMFWILAGGFMAFSGLLFSLYINQPTPPQADMLPLLQVYGTILLFITPLLAMRLLAEEQRSGRLEVLMTAPIDDWQLIFGKWLAAFAMFTVLIGFTLFHVGIMHRLAEKGIAPGPTFAAYVGLLLLGASLLALGVLTSSLTESQVVAGFLGIMLIMVLFFLSIVKQMPFGESGIGAAIAFAGLSDHYYKFGQGVIDTRDVVYFLSLTFGALFLATRVLETRRWR
jgi:ABC-2 type transport system permease protein